MVYWVFSGCSLTTGSHVAWDPVVRLQPENTQETTNLELRHVAVTAVGHHIVGGRGRQARKRLGSRPGSRVPDRDVSKHFIMKCQAIATDRMRRC